MNDVKFNLFNFNLIVCMSKKLNLIFLPFAGGSVYSYMAFEKYFDSTFNIHTVEYPGRGGRIGEPLVFDLDEIVDDAFNNSKPYLTEPYVIFGHSMGAFVGFLLLKLIKQHNLPMPRCLFVSGKSGPCVTYSEKTYLLSKPDFWERISHYGGCAPEVLKDQSLIDLFEPILRADIRALEEYDSTGMDAIYDIPIVALIGTEDKVKRDEALRWQEATTVPLKFYEFAGDHFFIFDNTKQIAELIKRTAIGLASKVS